MPPTELTDPKKIYALMTEEWQKLKEVLPGIVVAKNHPAILRPLINIYILYGSYIKYELPLRLKTLKTQAEIDETDTAALTTSVGLVFEDVLAKLNEVNPIHISPGMALELTELENTFTNYFKHPIPRHRHLLNGNPQPLQVHLSSLSGFFTFFRGTTSVSDFVRDFVVAASDAIMAEPRLHRLDELEQRIYSTFGSSNNEELTPTQKSFIHNAIGLADDLTPEEIAAQKPDYEFEVSQTRESLVGQAQTIHARLELLSRIDPENIRQFIQKDAYKAKFLYQRTFLDWAEYLIQQASFYCIKYPLEDCFHGRHHIVHAIIVETVKYIHKTDLSTIERMVHLTQFVLRQDLGNGVLLRLLTPVLQQVPQLEREVFQVYAIDKIGRDQVITKLNTYKDSEEFFTLKVGYEPYPILESQDIKETSRAKKPLEPVSPGEIAMRLRKLPSEVIRSSADTLAPNAMRRFLNWLRGLLTQGKMREHMVKELKARDPLVVVTEEGFIKRPPPAA